MKKSTIVALISVLNGETIAEPDTIKAELEAELNKGEARKQAQAESYAELYPIVMATLTNAPATISELYEAMAEDLPEGMTKGKVQYALTHLWQDEIVKVEGKPNGYRKA